MEEVLHDKIVEERGGSEPLPELASIAYMRYKEGWEKEDAVALWDDLYANKANVEIVAPEECIRVKKRVSNNWMAQTNKRLRLTSRSVLDGGDEDTSIVQAAMQQQSGVHHADAISGLHGNLSVSGFRGVTSIGLDGQASANIGKLFLQACNSGSSLASSVCATSLSRSTSGRDGGRNTEDHNESYPSCH